MTEAEWLASEEVFPMLRFILDHNGMNRRKAGRRKLRLFGCACCRQIWDRLTDARPRQAVEVAERLADGLVPKAEVERTRAQLQEARRDLNDRMYQDYEAYREAQHARGWDDDEDLALSEVNILFNPQAGNFASAGSHFADQYGAQQIAALRCIFGNPFKPVTFPRAWRTHNAKGLATAIYDNTNFNDLPILADALEEAGCDNADILNHCRQPGEHVRGCWVVDLILGRT
jgi:hypothetical protein